MTIPSRPAAWISAATVLLLLGVGCGQISVWEVRSRPASQAIRQIVEPNSAALFASSRQLRLDTPQLVAAKEFDRAAEKVGFGGSDASARFEFEAMSRAFQEHLSSDPTFFQRVEARKVYNHALERFLLATGGHVIRPDSKWLAALANQGVRCSTRQEGAIWPAERFDEIRFADDYVSRGSLRTYRSEGIGIPMVGIRKPSDSQLAKRTGEERFYPYFEVYPLTAFLRITGRRSAVLELHDTLRTESVDLPGGSYPLAVDLTTPTLYHFAKGDLERLEKVGLFSPQDTERTAGLHMLHPYERGKIPVVMIHGLASSPLAWAKVVNELRGDPRLRSRYQFWMFMYPSGNPFLLSASDLRKALIEARKAVDPDATDPAYDQMVLIGHSMGGLLARLAISESGDAIWKLLGNQPFERLAATEEERELMERLVFVHPVPSVRRVVFIATPHRGSELGGQFIGRVVDRLIKLPDKLRRAHDVLLEKNGPDFFTARYKDGLPSSIDELEEGNPMLMTIDKLHVNPSVTAHAIIGQVGQGRVELSTDGVVPYGSSHLDWTASELVIRANHFCQDDPQTIAEVRRILMLHLGDESWPRPGLTPGR